MAREGKRRNTRGKSRKHSSPKPGSNPEDVKAIGGKGDFGVPEQNVVGRTYTSRNTKVSDRGAAHPRSGEDPEGARVTGAGDDAVGPGSSSGGDVDTDIIGVGTGGSTVSASGVTHRPPGPDDASGTSDDAASGPHAAGKGEKELIGKVGGDKRVKGSTLDHSGGDIESTASGRGASAVNDPSRDNDAAAGEISEDEATGQDNS